MTKRDQSDIGPPPAAPSPGAHSGSTAAPEAPYDLTPEEKERGMHYGLYAATYGIIYYFAFNDNLLTLFVKRLGASNTQLGTLLSVMNLFAIAQVFVAGMVEKRGKKIFITRSWHVINVLSLGFMALPLLAESPHYGPQYAVRGLMALIVPLALMWQVAAVGWAPLLYDVVPGEVQGRYYAKMRTVWQIASVLFLLAINVFIAGQEHVPYWRYQVIFAVGIIASFARIWTTQRMPELSPVKHAEEPSLLRMLRMPLGDRTFRRYLLFTVLLAVALAISDRYAVVFLKSEALKYTDSRALFASTTMFFVGSAGSMFVWGPLADRVGARPLLIINLLGMGMARFLWFFALTPAGPFVIPAMFLMLGVFSAGFNLANTKYLFTICPRNFGKTTYVMVAAVASTLVGSGVIFLGGRMIDGLAGYHGLLIRYGVDEYRLLFVASGVMALAAAVILRRFKEGGTAPTREVLATLISMPLRATYSAFLFSRALPERAVKTIAGRLATRGEDDGRRGD